MGVDPISLAIIGMTIAGGVAQYAGGAKAKKAAERQADQADKVAQINADKKRRSVGRVLGKIRALEGEQDAQIIEFGGRQKAEEILQKGREAKTAGAVGMLTSFASAALGGMNAAAGPSTGAVGSNAFSAGTAAQVTSGGIRLPAGLPTTNAGIN